MGDAVKLTESLQTTVTRGAESWQFLAFVFAAAVAIIRRAGVDVAPAPAADTGRGQAPAPP